MRPSFSEMGVEPNQILGAHTSLVDAPIVFVRCHVRLYVA